MGSLILAAMAACVLLLPLSILAYRAATAPAAEPHAIDDGQHCSVLLHHPAHKSTRATLAASIPAARKGGRL
ncbi:hypothetical protein [Streptomyces sp. NBC_01763]|uniref:hypothetical protein n=1 Tax=Streptomyces sp. NBC_01763 TaxID=2975934 RepID=UPI002DDA729F|nr:hypothetical protein [Streptomyces sp. NBC_01763]WSC35684.1 hypothetical protein OHA08_09305 [Streptomyces sp. NBC_01763]